MHFKSVFLAAALLVGATVASSIDDLLAPNATVAATSRAEPRPAGPPSTMSAPSLITTTHSTAVHSVEASSLPNMQDRYESTYDVAFYKFLLAAATAPKGVNTTEKFPGFPFTEKVVGDIRMGAFEQLLGFDISKARIAPSFNLASFPAPTSTFMTLVRSSSPLPSAVSNGMGKPLPASLSRIGGEWVQKLWMDAFIIVDTAKLAAENFVAREIADTVDRVVVGKSATSALKEKWCALCKFNCIFCRTS